MAYGTVELNAGSGGNTIAVDSITSVDYQLIKLMTGGEGTATEVSTSNPLPIAGTAAENAAAAGNPLLSGGRYDATPRTLGDGDVGALALAADGAVHIDDGGNSITVDNASLTTIAGAVSGTEMQVDIISGNVTNAGTFAVQEDGAALTALQLLDDAVYVDDADWTNSVSKHLLVGGLYQSTPQTITDGDVGPFQVDSNGNMKVNIVSGGGSGGTNSTDDAAFTAASGAGTPAMGFVTSDAVDSGDVGVLSMDTNRSLHVSFRDGSGNVINPQVDDAAFTVATDSISVIGGIASSDSVDAGDAGAFAMSTDRHLIVDLGSTDNTVLDNILTSLQLIDDAVYVDDADWTDTTSKHLLVGGLYQSTPQTVTDGDVAPFQVDSNGVMKVNIVSGGGSGGTNSTDDSAFTAAVGAGTPMMGFATSDAVDSGDVGVLAMTTNRHLLADIDGTTAHSAADSTNPIKIGGYATNSIEGLTQVTAGDLSNIVVDLNGVQVTRPHTTLEEIISERITNTDGASTASTNFAAGGAGVHNYLTSATVYNSSGTDGFVDLRDGAAGSVLWTLPAPTLGGCVQVFNPPLKFSANTAVAYDASAALSTIYLSMNGFQAQG